MCGRARDSARSYCSRCQPIKNERNLRYVARNRKPRRTVQAPALPTAGQPMPGEEVREISIRMSPVCSRSKAAQERLAEALRDLRKERFEVEILLSGTWREVGAHRVHVLERVLWEHWQLRGGEIVGSVQVAARPLMPMPSRVPFPEVILRGVRRK